MNSELAIIPEVLTKECQLLDIGVKRAFKVKLQALWESANTPLIRLGGSSGGSYATICGWIVDTWAKVSVLTVVWAFAKASIIAEKPPDKTDYDNDEGEPGMFDSKITQLFNSETEDEDLDGFVTKDWSKNSVCIFQYVVEQCSTKLTVLLPFPCSSLPQIIRCALCMA